MIKLPVVSLKGGVGKSTIALNLAYELSKDNKVLLIDTDPQNSISSFLCKKFEKGFSEVLAGKEDIENTVIEISENFYIIPTGKFALLYPIEYEKIFTEHTYLYNIEKLEEYVDFLIFDTQPRISEQLEVMLQNSDIFLVIINPDPASFASFKIFLEYLENRNLTDKFYLVINDLHPIQIEEDFHKVFQYMVKDRLLSVIPSDNFVVISEGNCKPAVEENPNSAFSLAIKELKSKLINIVKQ